MEMKEQTIVDKYARLGVKPKILAELNACSTKDIEDILAKAGVYTPKQTKKRGKNMAAEQKAAPMPEIVLNTVLEKLDEIENQIKYHDEAKKKLEQEYTELAHAIGTSGK